MLQEEPETRDIQHQLSLIKKWIAKTEATKMAIYEKYGYRTVRPVRSRPPLNYMPKSEHQNWPKDWHESGTLRMRVGVNNRGQLELDLSDRKLYEIPKETFNFTRIQVLKICRNKISIVPSAIGHLRKLQIFDAHLNALMQVPDTICNCQHLSEIDLSSNKLRVLPPQIGLLHELKILRIGRNQFEHLPSELGLLESLKTLDIQSNRLWALPFTLENLKKLKSLNMSGNKIDIFPQQLCTLKNLQSLIARHNLLKSLPNDFENLKSLRELNLQHNQLDSFPDVILALKNVVYLNLSQNRIRTLPPQISKLSHLRNFHIEGNKLQSLTCNFESLENLNASDNHITNCALIEVRGLRFLNLNNNRLENLPLGVCQLAKLEVLKLSRNRIQYLSKDIELLKNLQHFDISYNKLTKLPQVINELEKLEYFNVRGNKVVNQPILLEKVRIDNGNPKSSYVKHMIEKYNADRKSTKSSWWSRKMTNMENKSVQATDRRHLSPVKRKYRRRQPQYHDSSTSTQTKNRHDVESNMLDVAALSSEDTARHRASRSNAGHKKDASPSPNRRRTHSIHYRKKPKTRQHLQTPMMQRKLDLSEQVLSDDNWTLIPKDDNAIVKNDKHPTSSSDDEPSLPESNLGVQKPRTEFSRTDFTLLGLCNQLESLLSQQLLKPVLSHKGNFGRNSISSLAPTPPPITSEMYEDNWKQFEKRHDLHNGDVRGNLIRLKADRFTVTPSGGIFKSTADPNIRIYFPVNAVDDPMDIILQIEKIDQEALLSAKLRSRTVDNILAMGHIIHLWQSVDVNFNEQVALTIPAPPSPQRGKLHVLTYQDDNTCTPCSSGYRLNNGYMTINAWHFSGKGAVLTRTKCKYKACKSVETLLRSFYV